MFHLLDFNSFDGIWKSICLLLSFHWQCALVIIDGDDDNNNKNNVIDNLHGVKEIWNWRHMLEMH